MSLTVWQSLSQVIAYLIFITILKLYWINSIRYHFLFKGIASITTLTFLALWRLIVVVRGPVISNAPFNQTSSFQCVTLSCIIWAYAMAITCPPLFGWGHYGLEAAHIIRSVPFVNFLKFIFRLFSNRERKYFLSSCSVNWESSEDYNQFFIA